MRKVGLFSSFFTAVTLAAGNAFATTSSLPYTDKLIDVQNFIGGPWSTAIGGGAVALAGLGWMKSDGGSIASQVTKIGFGGATAYSATSLALWMGSSGSVLF